MEFWNIYAMHYKTAHAILDAEEDKIQISENGDSNILTGEKKKKNQLIHSERKRLRQYLN